MSTATAAADGLSLDVVVVRDSFTLAARLAIAEGEVLAVLGPNGSGKSTLLDVVAGLVQPRRGTVRWRGHSLLEGGRAVPPAERRVGLLQQDPLLFPHLNALDNVAFGLRAQSSGPAVGATRSAARATAMSWLERFGVEALAARRPHELSGGQSARVALARALAAGPEVLLLDEPLAALDAAAAPELRQLIAATVREERLTTVLVSHDVLDAALLADRVAVLREGAVVEEGARGDVLGAPRTAFTAAFVGVNLVPAGFVGLRAAGKGDGSMAVGHLRFRPAAVRVMRERAGQENSWRARVRWLEPATGGVRVRLTTPDADGAPDVLADLDPAAVEGEWLQPDALVWAHVAPEEVQLV